MENFEAIDVDFNKFYQYLEILDRLSKLFKDPIVLRYCILFEFLKHRPIEEVFQNFYRKVGEKVIDFDTFQYWFNKFEQGIFDENREPVADMRDILRNDQRALRICILYVSHNYALIGRSTTGLVPMDDNSLANIMMPDRHFQIYSFFCEIIGENVMEYREFVYWQTRFSDGNFDLDHVRSEKALELTDMPIDIMKNLVQYLDIGDRAKVRRTSKAFHAFIDSQPLFLKNISFHIDRNSSQVEVVSNSNRQYSTIYTDNRQNALFFESNTRSRVVHTDDYKEYAIEHLKSIMQTPNLHLEHLGIRTDDFNLNADKNLIGKVPTRNDVLDGLASLINPSAKPHIKSIRITSTVLEPIVDFLSYLESGYLNYIWLDCEFTHGTGFSKMLELEQFKQAKEFNMSSMSFPGSVRDLLHLDKFSLEIDTIPVEDVRILKEAVFKSSTFKSCCLRVPPERQFDFNGIRRELDSLSPGIHENSFRHFIPNTEDCFEFNIRQSGISVIKKENYHEEDRRQMEINNRFRRLQM